MLKNKAVQKPSITKPCTTLLVSKISPAFITSRKIPSVKIVIGIVKMTKIGFTIVFKNASTAATNMAVQTESICTPGNRSEVTITAKTLMIN